MKKIWSLLGIKFKEDLRRGWLIEKEALRKNRAPSRKQLWASQRAVILE